MTSPTASDSDRYRALMAAVEGHMAYIKDAMTGKGIDRHLLGLQIVAEVRDLPPCQGTQIKHVLFTLNCRSRDCTPVPHSFLSRHFCEAASSESLRLTYQQVIDTGIRSTFSFNAFP